MKAIYFGSFYFCVFNSIRENKNLTKISTYTVYFSTSASTQPFGIYSIMCSANLLARSREDFIRAEILKTEDLIDLYKGRTKISN